MIRHIRKPHTACELHSSSTELDLLLFYIVEIGNVALFCSCDLDRDPMTFVYELGPYPMNMIFLRQGFRKLQTDIQTAATENITTPLRGERKRKVNVDLTVLPARPAFIR